VERRRTLERSIVERRTHPLAADVIAQLFDCVCVAVKRELTLFFRDEPALSDRRSERNIGPGVPRVWPDEIGDVADAANADDARGCLHFDVRRFCRRTDVDEIPARSQPSVRTV
jgi:hypothetical protein